jgi:hypothetical protein
MIEANGNLEIAHQLMRKISPTDRLEKSRMSHAQNKPAGIAS